MVLNNNAVNPYGVETTKHSSVLFTDYLIKPTFMLDTRLAGLHLKAWQL